MSIQIRTVTQNDPGIFDNCVNLSIKDGWKLTKRELVQTPAGTKDYYYAELVKEDDPKLETPPITWQQAVETIKGICNGREDCLDGGECPMFCYCRGQTPIWGTPNTWPEVPHD